MTMAEGDGIAGEKPPHDGGDGHGACTQQKMKMIRDECPGKTAGGCVNQNFAEPLDKAVTVNVIPENAFPLNPSANNMVQCTRRIDASFTWHPANIAVGIITVNL